MNIKWKKGQVEVDDKWRRSKNGKSSVVHEMVPYFKVGQLYKDFQENSARKCL